jgi:hypothetical protein
MTVVALVPRVYGVLWAITFVGVLASSLLGGAGGMQVTARRGRGLFVDVLTTNGRLVGAISLAALAVALVPAWRVVLDVVVAALLGANALAIGAALGATGPHVAGWLAHLPVEWAALAVAAALYLEARRRPTDRRSLGTWALGALGLVVLSAGIEAWGPRLG